VLGGGAFSRVTVVTEDSTGRSYAMKRMRKSVVVQCPEHVFCEQVGLPAAAAHVPLPLRHPAARTPAPPGPARRSPNPLLQPSPLHLPPPQAITKNTAHPFCIRQYASFQDKYHLYFLFDLMPGGDLMDVLVAEARVIKHRVPTSPWQARMGVFLGGGSGLRGRRRWRRATRGKAVASASSPGT
jgi:cGMP-dependent protein kinase 2